MGEAVVRQARSRRHHAPDWGYITQWKTGWHVCPIESVCLSLCLCQKYEASLPSDPSWNRVDTAPDIPLAIARCLSEGVRRVRHPLALARVGRDVLVRGMARVQIR
eukprot:scaffold64222_cov72-Phaeocystis_antarctica.AAC.1